jgi:hypothetical protein
MSTKLPERIAYLASVMNDLSAFDPATLGDDNPDALAIVESAVRSRVRRLDGAEAKETLDEDCATLGDWLKQPGAEVSTGHFVYGALMGLTMWADFDELAE